MFTDSRGVEHDLSIDSAFNQVIDFARKGVFDPEKEPDLADLIRINHRAITAVEAFADPSAAETIAKHALRVPEKAVEQPMDCLKLGLYEPRSLLDFFRVAFDKARFHTVSLENARRVQSDDAFFRQMAAIEMVEAFFVQNLDALKAMPSPAPARSRNAALR